MFLHSPPATGVRIETIETKHVKPPVSSSRVSRHFFAMKKFYILATLAFYALTCVTYVTLRMLDGEELTNKTEVGILLGIIATVCGVAWKALYENNHKDE